MIYSFLHLIFLGSFFPFITILIGMPSLYISKSEELNMQNITLKPCRIFIYLFSTTRQKKYDNFFQSLLRNFFFVFLFTTFFCCFVNMDLEFYNHFNTHQKELTQTHNKLREYFLSC